MADRSTDEIERDLENRRSELSSTINEIFDRMTLEGAWNYAGRYLRDHGGEHGQTVGNIVKEKPFAVGLVAIGMAWIVFGSRVSDRHSPQRENFSRSNERNDVESRTRLAATDRDDRGSGSTKTGSYTSPEAGVTPLEMPPSDPVLPTSGKTTSTSGQGVSSHSTGSTGPESTRGDDRDSPVAAPAVNPVNSPPRPPVTTSSGTASEDRTTRVASSKTSPGVSPSATKSSGR